MDMLGFRCDGSGVQFRLRVEGLERTGWDSGMRAESVQVRVEGTRFAILELWVRLGFKP